MVLSHVCTGAHWFVKTISVQQARDGGLKYSLHVSNISRQLQCSRDATSLLADKVKVVQLAES